MDKEVHKALYGKYNGIVHACTNSVYQASRGGRGVAGKEAKTYLEYFVNVIFLFALWTLDFGLVFRIKESQHCHKVYR